MASLYARKQILWLKFRDEHGIVRRVSTQCRVGVAPDVRRARQLKAQKDLAELSYSGNQRGETWAWVPDFLSIRYATRPVTLERYDDCWRTLKLFLDERRIQQPSQFIREHCFEYVNWRSHPNLKIGKYRAGRNTALLDLKCLRIIMTEAMIRGYCQGNPCIRLGIERADPKIKPALTEDEIKLIREAIQKVADPDDRNFFFVSFEIARYQGCRLNETRLNLSDVSLTDKTITFRTKGRKTLVTLLHPNLIPLFQRLQSEKRIYTWEPPANTKRAWAQSKWHRFLHRLELNPSACFHSLRVTAITDMIRGGVPENLVRKYVGHASTLVNRGYQRLNHKDLAACAQAIV
jgi:site-specific recombinase XerD